jgi:thiol-disulfide isomerase/thioredoxin
LRSNFWRSLALDVLLIAAVFFAIHSWQTRDLPIDEPAPETVLSLLDAPGAQSAIRSGEAGVVYFFAPWCFYCRTSIDNLDGLVANGKVGWATAVALDFTDADEVREFVGETGISLPVLMGDASTARDWSVRAFPTYYVIDSDGRISSRSVGYSTLLGMWFRYTMARAR